MSEVRLRNGISRLPCGLEATSVAMLCVEWRGQSLKDSWGDRAGRVGGGGMTQLAVSVILVGKCVLAQGGRDEAGFAGGCRERQWAWSSEKVSSAGNCIRGWKIGCRVEAGDRVNCWVWYWMPLYSIKLDKQKGRQAGS